MAIQDPFNISEARSNQAYAYKCWYNYNYENNTMGIPSSAMGEITTQYKGVLQNWQATATNDENQYEISDEEFDINVDKGYSEAANDAGYEGGGKGGMIVRGAGDAVLSAGGVIAGKAAGSAAVNTLGKVGLNNSMNIAKNGVTEGGKAGKKTNGAWIISAPMALATGTLYQAKKPNKDQHNAAVELTQTILPEAQANAMEAQSEMSEADSELLELADEAESVNDDTNDDIEEDKSDFDLYKKSYDKLIKKIESGEQLTEEEKELLKELVPLMQQLGEDIGELSDETIDYIQELYGDMETYQEYFDKAAETIANIQGITDYAESFDNTAETMMYVEAGAQTLNAASGADAAVSAGRFAASGGWTTAWAWAFVGMGAAGSVMSGLGASEQMQWAKDTGNEIDLRNATQDLNGATNDVYGERVEDYEGYMDIVGNLELEVPDDIEPPEEEPEVPEDQPEDGTTPGTQGTGGGANGAGSTGGTTSGTGGSTGGNIGTDDPKKTNKTSA